MTATLLERLGTKSFCRISASHIVNMAQIRLVRRGSVLMMDGAELTFGRVYKKDALEAINRYIGGSI